MKILVLGGNRFFGKQLVINLVKEGHEVFVFNRGNTANADGTISVKGSRKNKNDLRQLADIGPFEVIYDQICMDLDDAKSSLEFLYPLSPRVITTSSMSVYEYGENHREQDLSDKDIDWGKTTLSSENYALAKRQLDLFLLREAPKHTTTLRLPIVLGKSDYTRRLHWHIERALNEKEIYFPNLDAQLNFALCEDLITPLSNLKRHPFSGALNLASPGTITLSELCSLFEDTTGKKLKLAKKSDDEIHSPFGIEKSWTMDLSLAESNQLLPPKLTAWLQNLVKELAEELSHSMT